MSFAYGRKGGSGLCLGERDFDLNISTRTQWRQKKKITNSYDSHDGLMTMAALVVVATIQQLRAVAADSSCTLCSVGTSGHRRLTNHAHGTDRERIIIRKKSTLENGEGFLSF